MLLLRELTLFHIKSLFASSLWICISFHILDIYSESIKKTTISATAASIQTINGKINAGMAYEFSGNDRIELNLYMQHGLVNLDYTGNTANRICKYVVAHCNDERMLSEIHNDLKREFED